MKRVLAALMLVGATALGTDAGAVNLYRTYYVKPTGDDALSGLTFATAWQTIEHANSFAECTADSDAVILVYGSYREADNDWNGPASYSGFPNPANTPAQPRRFAYYGNLGNYGGSGTQIGAVGDVARAKKPRVSIRGFLIPHGLTMDSTAVRDSIADCYISGDVHVNGTDSLVFANCDIAGKHFAINSDVPGCEVACADTFVYNRMPHLEAVGGYGFAVFPHVRTLYFAFNQVGISNWGDAATTPRVLWDVHKSVFLGNRWTTDIRAYGEDDDAYAYALSIRDGCDSLTFTRDTIYAHTPRNADVAQSRMLNAILLPALGEVPGSVFAVSVDSSYWSCNGRFAIYGQDVLRNLSLTNTVVASGGGMALRGRTLSGCTFDHNTFIGDNYGRRFNGTDSIPTPFDEAGVVNLGGTFVGDTTKFTNNIVYLMRPGLQTHGTDWDHSIAAVMPYDSTTFLSDWNLYGAGPYQLAPGDGSILTRVAGQYAQYTPAAFYAATLHTGTTAWKQEARSTWGSPQFDFGGRDSVFRAAPVSPDSLFNPRLGPRSAGLTAGKSGTAIGARPYDAIPSMTLSAAGLDFSPEVLMPDTAYVTIGNVGTDSLRISGVVESDEDVVASVTDAAIGPGKTTTLAVIVTPTEATSATHYVDFITNDPNHVAARVYVYVHFSPIGTGYMEP